MKERAEVASRSVRGVRAMARSGLFKKRRKNFARGSPRDGAVGKLATGQTGSRRDERKFQLSNAHGFSGSVESTPYPQVGGRGGQIAHKCLSQAQDVNGLEGGSAGER